jgi:hypothetical protein
VSAFEQALRQPYPLPKLDLVGIPNFGAGAMENWGLITYRWGCAGVGAERLRWGGVGGVGWGGTWQRLLLAAALLRCWRLRCWHPLPAQARAAAPRASPAAPLLPRRETALLVDPAAEDIQQSFWIADVVSHEISHQWFGNLVTMADWGELWLNEGFATYLESMGGRAGPAGLAAGGA